MILDDYVSHCSDHLENAQTICENFNISLDLVNPISEVIEQLRCKSTVLHRIATPELQNAIPNNASEIRSLLAEMKPLADRLVKLSDYYDPSSILSNAEAADIFSTNAIMAGAIALGTTRVRPHSVNRAEAMLPYVMMEIGEIWRDIADDDFDAPFGPDEEGCQPMENTGPAFIVEMLEAAGWPFSSMQVRDNMPAMREALDSPLRFPHYKIFQDVMAF